LNELSGSDYNWFFNQWYYGKGYPLYDIAWKQRGDSVFMTSLQTPVTPEAGFFKMHYNVKFKFITGDTTIRVFQDVPEKLFSFKLKGNATEMQVNPEETSLMRITNVSAVAEIPSFDDFMKISPNPFMEDFKISFLNESANDMFIKIVNIDGKEVASIKRRKRREVKIDLGDAAPGVYVLYVICDNKKYVRKLIKTY